MYMDAVFLTKLFLAFAIGGIWVILSTVIADRYGSKIGGLLSGLPSTVAFSLLFLAWTQTSTFAIQATTVTPIAIGIENLFVLTYIFLVYRGVFVALVSSFFVWFLLAFGLVYIHFDNYPFSLLAYILSLGIFYIIVENILKIVSVKGKNIVFSPKTILLRGLLSGSIIAFSVLMGKVGGPMLGGIFAGFPAIFTSTMLVTYFSRGASFSAATMKSSVLSFISGVVYSVVVRYTYVPLGIVFGTIVAIGVSVSCGILMYRIIIARLR